MSIEDIGPKPTAFDIEEVTKANPNYRQVAWTGTYLQVTLMSIPPKGEIGLEVHPETDQFLRVEDGQGIAMMGDSEDNLDYEQELKDDWVVLVPAGKWHNVVNPSETEDLKLYSIYAPVHHAEGKIQPTKEDADRDEEEGNDEPPARTVQP